jgi:hypothetical protein
MYSGIGTRRMDLPQTNDAIDSEDWNSSNEYGGTGNKVKLCIVEGED